MKKRFIALTALGILLLAGGGFLVYKFYIEPDSSLKAIYLVPNDAIYILETEEPVKAWQQISKSSFWQHLKGHPYIAELTDGVDALDSFMEENQKVFDLFGSRQILVSAHMFRHNDYDFLYVIDLKKAAKLAPLRTYLANFAGKGSKVTYRKHKGQEIMEITDTDTRETLYLAFIENLMVLSYTNSILEKSIDQLEEPYIGRHQAFIEVERKTSHNNLFRLYFNYDQLDEYLAMYMEEEDELVNSLSKQIFFSGLGAAINASGLISMEGFTSINFDEPSHLQAMLKAGKGKIKAWEIAPQRTAFYLSLSFSKFSKFIQEVESVYSQESESYREYLANMDKLERFLNISIDEHFYSWVDDEVALIQNQPTGQGKDNEFAVVFKTTSIQKAEQNLDYISRQIRRKTPVKFKEITYRGHKIRFLSVKGFFKLILGKLFSKLDKPYYTTLGNYVVFSNSPITLRSMINDFEDGKTLANLPDFQGFLSNFDQKSNFFFFMQTPVMFNNLKNMVDRESWTTFEKNKDYMVCFSNLGFQLTANGNGFDSRLHGQFTPIVKVKEEEKVALASMRNSLREQLRDTLFTLTEISEEDELMKLEDIDIAVLDAKRQEEFHENGALKVRVSLKDGMKDGSYFEYYPNGELRVKGRYKDDLQDGTWRFYDEAGKMVRKVRYRRGNEL